MQRYILRTFANGRRALRLDAHVPSPSAPRAVFQETLDALAFTSPHHHEILELPEDVDAFEHVASLNRRTVRAYLDDTTVERVRTACANTDGITMLGEPEYTPVTGRVAVTVTPRDVTALQALRAALPEASWPLVRPIGLGTRGAGSQRLPRVAPSPRVPVTVPVPRAPAPAPSSSGRSIADEIGDILGVVDD